MSEKEIQQLQKYYEELSATLLELLRSGLLPEGSQERHEATLNYDRWLAKSYVLKLVLQKKPNAK